MIEWSRMKSIVTVNTVLPTVENSIEYCSGESLRDYDIVLFDPQLPYEGRIDFSGGGSCISIEGTQRIQSAMRHWNGELHGAIKAGKTVFVILNKYHTDMAANGSSLNKSQRTYNTFQINNYEALPIKINVSNTKGRQIIVVDNNYKSLYDALKEVAQYRVIFENQIGKKIYTTKDGAVVATVAKLDNFPGSIVFLPYFNLAEHDQESEEWTDSAIRISKGIANQLVAIDKILKQNVAQTPPPEWLESIEKPNRILEIDETIKVIETDINSLEKQRLAELESKNKLLEFSQLLYESGKGLESAIQKSLELFGYSVENYRSGDLEIDHIILSPEGLRMIGESEGKDNSSIDISKFRQLESNINEDFERDNVNIPAKGILFGNGFRFTAPEKRGEQFTQKCFTNAKRLGTALIRTTDLYKAVVCVLNNPEDDTFKKGCRDAIENTAGEIVKFPLVQIKPNPVEDNKDTQ